jgi:hypothetical protein
MSLKTLKMIAVSEENYLALKRLGSAGDSFNDVVTEVLKKVILWGDPAMDAVLLSQLSHKNRKEKQTMDLSTCKILSISDY